MENNKWEEKNYAGTPLRISLDDLKRQKEDILAIKELEKRTKPKTKTVFNAVSMYGVAVDFALLIAIPLIVMIFLGRWADKKFGTSYLIIVGVLLAITISSVSIYRQISKLYKLIKKK